MEEIREEKISEILSWLQAAARGKMARQTFNKLKAQKVKMPQDFLPNNLLIKFLIILLFFIRFTYWQCAIVTFVAGSLLRSANHQEFHDRQDLDVVAALAGHQAKVAEHQVCRNQGLVGGQNGGGREEERTGEVVQTESWKN